MIPRAFIVSGHAVRVSVDSAAVWYRGGSLGARHPREPAPGQRGRRDSAAVHARPDAHDVFPQLRQRTCELVAPATETRTHVSAAVARQASWRVGSIVITPMTRLLGPVAHGRLTANSPAQARGDPNLSRTLQDLLYRAEAVRQSRRDIFFWRVRGNEDAPEYRLNTSGST